MIIAMAGGACVVTVLNFRVADTLVLRGSEILTLLKLIQAKLIFRQAFFLATSSRLVPKSFSITAAALRPGVPVTEPPGAVHAPV